MEGEGEMPEEAMELATFKLLRLVKLEHTMTGPIWINPAFIAAVGREADGSTGLLLATGECIPVREDVATVVLKLEGLDD